MTTNTTNSTTTTMAKTEIASRVLDILLGSPATEEETGRLFSDDFAACGPGRDIVGVRGVRGISHSTFEAFSDVAVTTQEIRIAGNRVSARVTLTACQTGTYQGVAPTGKIYCADGVVSFKLRDGQVCETATVLRFSPVEPC